MVSPRSLPPPLILSPDIWAPTAPDTSVPPTPPTTTIAHPCAPRRKPRRCAPPLYRKRSLPILGRGAYNTTNHSVHGIRVRSPYVPPDVSLSEYACDELPDLTLFLKAIVSVARRSITSTTTTRQRPASTAVPRRSPSYSSSISSGIDSLSIPPSPTARILPPRISISVESLTSIEDDDNDDRFSDNTNDPAASGDSVLDCTNRRPPRPPSTTTTSAANSSSTTTTTSNSLLLSSLTRMWFTYCGSTNRNNSGESRAPPSTPVPAYEAWPASSSSCSAISPSVAPVSRPRNRINNNTMPTSAPPPSTAHEFAAPPDTDDNDIDIGAATRAMGLKLQGLAAKEEWTRRNRTTTSQQHNNNNIQPPAAANPADLRHHRPRREKDSGAWVRCGNRSSVDSITPPSVAADEDDDVYEIEDDDVMDMNEWIPDINERIACMLATTSRHPSQGKDG